MIESISTTVKRMKCLYGIDLCVKDHIVLQGNIYISTRKAAEFLGTGYHFFCLRYTKVLAGRVGTYRQGRFKWYNLTDLKKIVEKKIKTGKTVFEICK